MKKTILMMVLLSGIACGKAVAQDTLLVAPPPQIAKTIQEKLDHELTLSSQQETEVYALLLERSKKFDQVRGSSKAQKLSKASFRQANEEALTKLQQVLTPEQYERLRVLRQEAKLQKVAFREEELYKSLQDIELDF